jgi:hypothetical protein
MATLGDDGQSWRHEKACKAHPLGCPPWHVHESKPPAKPIETGLPPRDQRLGRNRGR